MSILAKKMVSKKKKRYLDPDNKFGTQLLPHSGRHYHCWLSAYCCVICHISYASHATTFIVFDSVAPADLDLSYINVPPDLIGRLIAMGIPSEGFEAAYRNNMQVSLNCLPTQPARSPASLQLPWHSLESGRQPHPLSHVHT